MTSDLQKTEQTCSCQGEQDFFASRAVSWCTSPWWPWRSDLLRAHGSGTWRLSRAGSCETLFLHALQHREAWRQTQPTPVQGLTLTWELLLETMVTLKVMCQGAPALLGGIQGGATPCAGAGSQEHGCAGSFQKAFCICYYLHELNVCKLNTAGSH